MRVWMQKKYSNKERRKHYLVKPQIEVSITLAIQYDFKKPQNEDPEQNAKRLSGEETRISSYFKPLLFATVIADHNKKHNEDSEGSAGIALQ